MRDIKCRSCVNYRNNWCHRIADDPHPDLLRDCQYYRETTNADHIRSMSDEELAKWLADMWDCSYCSEYDRTGGHPLFSAEPCDQKCEQHCFDWLKQPYKEEV